MMSILPAAAHAATDQMSTKPWAAPQTWLDEVTTARVTGMCVDPAAGKVTLTKFHEQWSARQVWETTTTRTLGPAMDCCTFADGSIGQVRRSHVETWVQTMSATLAPTTVRSRYSSVRAVLRAAVADRVIASDPSAGVRLPRVPRRDSSAWTLPTSKQVRALLKDAPDGFGAGIGLAAFAGLRSSEIAGVQVGDIDFLRGILHVRRQVQRGEGTVVEIRPPKYGSQRDVAIPAGLVSMLSSSVLRTRCGLPRRRQPENRL